MKEVDATLERGQDVVLENVPPQEQWAAVALHHAHYPAGLWLVVAPHCEHPIMAGGDGLRVAHIVPEMTDDARRATANALRAREIDVLFVTPERFGQEKFLTFLTELTPVVVVVSSAQGCVAGNPETRAHFAPLGVLREALRCAPKIIVTDNRGDARKLIAYFSLNCPPVEMPVEATAPAQEKGSPAAEKNTPVNPAWGEAFRHFATSTPLAEVGDVLQQDEAWCVAALISFIEAERRTNPFPWVSQPDYLIIAMAAGQAESTDPRILLPILADRVAPGPARIALAALRNRALSRPRP